MLQTPHKIASKGTVHEDLTEHNPNLDCSRINLHRTVRLCGRRILRVLAGEDHSGRGAGGSSAIPQESSRSFPLAEGHRAARIEWVLLDGLRRNSKGIENT